MHFEKPNPKIVVYRDFKNFSTAKSQRQPPRGVPGKRCSENIQQMYRRKPMPKSDFNKVASNLLHILRIPFPRITSWRLLLKSSLELFVWNWEISWLLSNNIHSTFTSILDKHSPLKKWCIRAKNRILWIRN